MPLITEELPNIPEIQEKIIEQTKQVQLEDSPVLNVNNNHSDLYLILFGVILAVILIKYINFIIKLLIVVGVVVVCFFAYTYLI
jgi:fatty-acid desaturase